MLFLESFNAKNKPVSIGFSPRREHLMPSRRLKSGKKDSSGPPRKGEGCMKIRSANNANHNDKITKSKVLFSWLDQNSNEGYQYYRVLYQYY